MSMLNGKKWTPTPLGRRQASLLESLWENGPQSTVELHERLSQKEPLAYTTVHTELSRLLQKGLVAKTGRNLETRYMPSMSREAYLQATVSHTLTELIGSHGAAAIHGFVDLVARDEGSLKELKRALRLQQKK